MKREHIIYLGLAVVCVVMSSVCVAYVADVRDLLREVREELAAAHAASIEAHWPTESGLTIHVTSDSPARLAVLVDAATKSFEPKK